MMMVENDLWITHFSLWETEVVLAWALILAGALIRLWAIIHIGGHKNEGVVTSGPYGINRNPLYTGSFLCLVGICVLSGCLVTSLWTISAFAFIYGATIRHEEQRLAAAFGSGYMTYMHRVPRFLPRIAGPEDAPLQSVTVRDVAWTEKLWNVRRELRTSAGFIAAALLVWGLEYLNHEGHEYGMLPNMIDVAAIQLGLGPW